MAIYAAVLDACVMVPVSLCDTLLRLAEERMFRPVWSERILEETSVAIKTVHPDIPEGLIDRRIQSMGDVEVIHPDDFLISQLDMRSRTVLDTLLAQANAAKNPRLSLEDVLNSLARAGVPRFVDEVRRRL